MDFNDPDILGMDTYHSIKFSIKYWDGHFETLWCLFWRLICRGKNANSKIWRGIEERLRSMVGLSGYSLLESSAQLQKNLWND